MTLRTSVLISLLLAIAGAFVGYHLLTAIPFETSPVARLDPAQLGHFAAALLAGLATYGVAVVILAGGSALADLLAVRRNLLQAGGDNPGDHLKVDAWEAAFAGTTLAALASRLVVRSVAFDDDRLLLGAPFSASAARAELRGFYPRRLAIAQIGILAIALLIAAALPLFPVVPSSAAKAIASLALIADVLMLIAFAFFALLLTAAIEALVTVLARLPLLLDAAKRAEVLMAALQAGSAAVGQLPIAAAAALRGESEMMLRRVEKIASHAQLIDRTFLDEVADGVTAAVFTSLDQRLALSLQNFDRLAVATEALGEDMTRRIAALPELFAQQYATEREALMRTVGEAITATQRALHEALSGLQKTLTGAAEKQFEELRRVGAEARQANVQLAETVCDACLQIEQDRQAGFAKTAQLIDAIESYTASLLPAIKRLEAYDERVLRTASHQDQTLSQLSVAVTELSGMIEATRMVLAQNRPATASPLEETKRGEAEPARGTSDEAEQPSLAALIRSLLDEMEDRQPVD